MQDIELLLDSLKNSTDYYIFLTDEQKEKLNTDVDFLHTIQMLIRIVEYCIKQENSNVAKIVID